jgi:hypothetical protein
MRDPPVCLPLSASGPPVSALPPRGCHAMCSRRVPAHARAIKVSADSAVPPAPLSERHRRRPPRLMRRRPWVSERRCPSAPPPLSLRLRAGCRRAVCARAPPTPPSTPSGRRRLHPVRHGAGTMQLGRGRFGLVTVDLFFYFPNIFKSLKIQNLCRIRLNSENYETNFVG